ncbi:MAG: peptidoglycan DD-metalloendopeptidase family protein [Chloroflexi bacterium]|nr:peptidoglycan DD-metalloendopeptidase family protein [Chloroflexota bacterium]RJR13652.1 MAG: LysM peptidoglycan-binding domain-containing protein [Candidatus Parcubacteria bacterium]
MRRKLFVSFITILLVLTCNINSSFAQDTPTYPVYVVQPGETLTEIANKFNTTVDAIIDVNGIVNADLISEGTELMIPGLEGISGRLETHAVNVGETLEDLALSNNIPLSTLLSLNKITSPNEVYIGTNLIIPVASQESNLLVAADIQPQDTPIETAVRLLQNPWVLLYWNDLRTGNSLITNTPVFAEINPDKAVSLISPIIRDVDISPLPLVQGTTIVVTVQTAQALELNGMLDTYTLHFFPDTDRENTYYAIQGIHAMAVPGLVKFNLSGSTDGQTLFSYDQMLLQEEGIFIKDPPLYVQDETVDPAITGPEDDLVRSIISQVTPDKYWQNSFHYPVDGSVEDDTIGFMSTFGNRRSYNGSDYTYFHSGLDFGVYVNSLNIYAPADGVVAYTGSLTVRGNATFIDHGQGIYSGYFHQAEIKVNIGDHVQQGQLIGIIGGTGRVTGPHLHWEIWANGVQVNPVNWVNNSYP